MKYCVLIISLLLESSLTTIVNKSSLFIPLFFITSLVILYPYFKNKKENFYITIIIFGLIYDIAYSNSIFINTLSFIFCGILITVVYNYLNYNIFNSNFINIIVLVFYRIISYILLCIVDYISFDESILLKGIYSSIILNIIYGIVIFMVISFIAKKFNIKKVD